MRFTISPFSAKSCSPQSAPARPAFALIIAITIMAFLVLLLTSLTTMVMSETEVADNHAQLELARQNATLGMQKALSQIQKHLGPDQRATAQATVYYGDPNNASASSVWSEHKKDIKDQMVASSTFATGYANPTFMTRKDRGGFETTIQDWWNGGNFQPRWVGVFDSSLRYDGSDPDTLTANGYLLRDYTQDDQQPVWLVSGFDESAPTSTTPITPTVDSSGNTMDMVTIVNTGSVPDPADRLPADGLKGLVEVPKVPLQDGQSRTIGSYAYYVSDESQKINVSLQDPFHDDDEPGDTNYMRRLISPQRSGLEGMSLFDVAYGTTPWDEHDERFADLLYATDLDVIASQVAAHLPDHYHSITTDSMGIFADGARGGLRKDLTNYFTGSGSGPNDDDPIADPALYQNDDRFGPQESGNPGFPNVDDNIPTFGQLKKWVNNVSTGTSDPVDVTAEVKPVLTQFRLFHGFSRNSSTINWELLPVIVMWNPYDAPLASTDYTVRIFMDPRIKDFRVATKLMYIKDAEENSISAILRPEDYWDPPGAYDPYVSTSEVYGSPKFPPRSIDDFEALDVDPSNNQNGVEVFIVKNPLKSSSDAIYNPYIDVQGLSPIGGWPEISWGEAPDPLTQPAFGSVADPDTNTVHNEADYIWPVQPDSDDNSTPQEEDNTAIAIEGYYIRSLSNLLPQSGQFVEDFRAGYGLHRGETDADIASDDDFGNYEFDEFVYGTIDDIPTYDIELIPKKDLDGDGDTEPIPIEFTFNAAFQAGEFLIFTVGSDQSISLSNSDNFITINLVNDFAVTGPTEGAKIQIARVNDLAPGLDSKYMWRFYHQMSFPTSYDNMFYEVEATSGSVKINHKAVLGSHTSSHFVSYAGPWGANNMTADPSSGFGSGSGSGVVTALYNPGDALGNVNVAAPITTQYPVQAAIDYPAFWRWLYVDKIVLPEPGIDLPSFYDQIGDTATSVVTANTITNGGSTMSDMWDPAAPNSPIRHLAAYKMEPMTMSRTNPQEHLDDIGAVARRRIFASNNLTADVIDINYDIEYSRGTFHTNNDDAGARTKVFDSIIRLSGGGYGPNLSSYGGGNKPFSSALAYGENLGSGINGYSFIKNEDDGSGDFAMTTEISIRAINRNPDDLISIAQLSHANLTKFFWQPTFAIGNSEATPHVSRKYISGIHRPIFDDQIGQLPYVRNHGGILDKYAGTQFVTDVPANTLIDVSYLLNDAMWDGMFMSTVPQTGDITGVLNGTRGSYLPSNTFKVRQDMSVTADDIRDYDNAARYLFNKGAFNVNTPSVDAWKAVLTAFRGLKIQGDSDQNPDSTMPVVHSTNPVGDPVYFEEGSDFDATSFGAVTSDRDYRNVVSGFRYLTDEMITRLAERIVDEIRFRGPFLNIADFVNRRLVDPHGFDASWAGSEYMVARHETSPIGFRGLGFMPFDYDPLIGLDGINGALQRAINLSGINGGVNYPEDINTDLGGEYKKNDFIYRPLQSFGYLDSSGNWDASTPAMTSETTFSSADADVAFSVYGANRWFLDTEHFAGAPAGESGALFSHTPGFVTQADILSMIGSNLTARGDTFKIRSYGEVRNPVTQEVEAEAWLETVVQRIPDPVTGSAVNAWEPDDPAVLGRQFRIVSTRWLGKNEI